jgi:predicted nicotinamide N-methyase
MNIPRHPPRDAANRRDRLDLVEEEIIIGADRFLLRRPLDAAALVSEEDFAENEFLPYWAEIWPAGLRLAESLPHELSGLRVVELGCGLGIPSLLAARRGAQVCATDWSREAIALLQENADANAIALDTAVIDWSAPGELLERAPFDLVLCADVLYERRNVDQMIALLPLLAPRILLADPGRELASAFFAESAVLFTSQDLGGGVNELHRRAPG